MNILTTEIYLIITVVSAPSDIHNQNFVTYGDKHKFMIPKFRHALYDKIQQVHIIRLDVWYKYLYYKIKKKNKQFSTTYLTQINK